MAKTKTRTDVLKEKYGFSKGSYNYIPKGGEILKYIGEVVILVSYKKEEDGWHDKFEKAIITSMNDFEPMTMTYMCQYKTYNENGEEVIDEVRIQPEGYSYENPEDTGEFKRFLPYSLHCKFVEDEHYFLRVKELYENRNTLPVESLINLSSSKEMATQLRYSRNICAVVRLEDGTILCTRIQKLSVKHRQGNKYSLTFANEDRPWSVIISSDDVDYDFESLGRVKLIDLSE